MWEIIAAEVEINVVTGEETEMGEVVLARLDTEDEAHQKRAELARVLGMEYDGFSGEYRLDRLAGAQTIRRTVLMFA